MSTSNAAAKQKIQTGGRPEIFLGGFAGKEFQHSYPNITGMANRYQWDIVFPDGDIHMAVAEGP